MSDDIRDEFVLTLQNGIFVQTDNFHENGGISIQDASWSPRKNDRGELDFQKNGRTGYNVILQIDGITKEASQVPLNEVEFTIQVFLGRKKWDELPKDLI